MSDKKPNIEELVITKKQLVDAIPKFVEQYGRLPYMKEDEVIVEVEREEKDKDGNNIIVKREQPYKAMKYIDGHFLSVDRFTKHLFNEGIISFEIISDKIDIRPKRIKELLKKTAKKIKVRERRMIDVFFNQDFYEEDEGKLEKSHCAKCTKAKKCGQPYWVGVISCAKYRESKRKKK